MPNPQKIAGFTPKEEKVERRAPRKKMETNLEIKKGDDPVELEEYQSQIDNRKTMS